MVIGWVLFAFDGRIDRELYWLGLGLVWSVFLVVASALAAAMGEDAFAIAATFAGIAVMWPEMALLSKRLHDRGWPGWLCLLNLVPAFGVVWTILLGLVPGDAGRNRYGPPPV